MRKYCPDCFYPSKTCLCHAITKTSSPLRVLILQHPQEAKHAKNTARLVKLVLPDTDIIVGDKQSNYQTAQNLIYGKNAALVYPSGLSVPIENRSVESQPLPEILIFIDASWPQAFGIKKRCEWLDTLPSYHFSTAKPSHYRIRHTPQADSLSTLEAVAYSLHALCGFNVSHLYTAQQAMQSNWAGPASHRRKDTDGTRED